MGSGSSSSGSSSGTSIPAPAPITISFQFELSGVTVARFGANKATYEQAVASALSVDASAVSLKIITARTLRGRLLAAGTTVGRLSLRATVTTIDPSVATAVLSALNSAGIDAAIVSSLAGAGITGAAVTIDKSSIQIITQAPTPAPSATNLGLGGGTLRSTRKSEGDDKRSTLEIAAIATLVCVVLIVIAATMVYHCIKEHKNNTVDLSAPATPKPEKQQVGKASLEKQVTARAPVAEAPTSPRKPVSLPPLDLALAKGPPADGGLRADEPVRKQLAGA